MVNRVMMRLKQLPYQKGPELIVNLVNLGVSDFMGLVSTVNTEKEVEKPEESIVAQELADICTNL